MKLLFTNDPGNFPNSVIPANVDMLGHDIAEVVITTNLAHQHRLQEAAEFALKHDRRLIIDVEHLRTAQDVTPGRRTANLMSQRRIGLDMRRWTNSVVRQSWYAAMPALHGGGGEVVTKNHATFVRVENTVLGQLTDFITLQQYPQNGDITAMFKELEELWLPLCRTHYPHKELCFLYAPYAPLSPYQYIGNNDNQVALLKLSQLGQVIVFNAVDKHDGAWDVYRSLTELA